MTWQALFSNPALRGNTEEPTSLKFEDSVLELRWMRSEKYPDSGIITIEPKPYMGGGRVKGFMQGWLRKHGYVPGKFEDSSSSPSAWMTLYVIGFRERKKRVPRNDLTKDQQRELEELLLKIIREAYDYWYKSRADAEAHGVWSGYWPKEPQLSTGHLHGNVTRNYRFSPLKDMPATRTQSIVRSALERLSTRKLVVRTTGTEQGREVKMWEPT